MEIHTPRLSLNKCIKPLSGFNKRSFVAQAVTCDHSVKSKETELSPHFITDNHALGQGVSHLLGGWNKRQCHLLLLP
eukprot:139515-Amphidinium_carterae.3